MARIFRILQKLLEHMNSLKCNNSSECLQNHNIGLQTICFSRVYTEFLNYTITTSENEGNQFFNSPRYCEVFQVFLTKYSFYIECRKLDETSFSVRQKEDTKSHNFFYCMTIVSSPRRLFRLYYEKIWKSIENVMFFNNRRQFHFENMFIQKFSAHTFHIHK